MNARLLQRTLALAACIGLAACGGGGNGGGAAETPSTATASESSEGFIAFIASLDGGLFDNAEPFDLSNFSAPTDDTDSDAPAATPVDE
ncbi:MAG TPA: hypothetical protein VJM48_08680 [Methylibium sp.]|jgi:hypothetical protein|nr:hypothetical protein [Methylibium sp.]